MSAKILSVGIVPVRRSKSGWEFLLLRAYNYWDFPKGVTDRGEEPWQTARRELEEETGIIDFQLPWEKKFIETLPYSRHKIARYYLAQIEGNVEIRLLPNPMTGKVEHHQHKWLPYEKARKLLVPRVQQVLDWAMQEISASFPDPASID